MVSEGIMRRTHLRPIQSNWYLQKLKIVYCSRGGTKQKRVQYMGCCSSGTMELTELLANEPNHPVSRGIRTCFFHVKAVKPTVSSKNRRDAESTSSMVE